MRRCVEVFAPASIGNVCVGFDVLGLAVDALGDRVRARVRARRAGEPAGAVMVSVRGVEGVDALPPCDATNAAAIAASGVVAAADVDAVIELDLLKGLPTGSGMGSSSASAVAGAQAANLVLGGPLAPVRVLACCLEAEAAVSGRHADNIAPALLGGLVLVRRCDPMDVVRLPVPAGLCVVVVRPELEVLTRDARAALAESVALRTVVEHSADLGAFVAACYSGDLDLLGRCLSDPLAEQARIGMIRGGGEALAAMRGAGSLGASISGSGPSLFALCRSVDGANEAGAAAVEALARAGVASRYLVSPADCAGAREV